MTVPNPGSDEAGALGCLCPVIDNAHGRGAYGGGVIGEDGQPLFWRRDDCPLHGVQTKSPAGSDGAEEGR